MSEAVIWKRTDGTMVLEWPEGKRTIAITREVLETMVLELNERASLRAALDTFLVFDMQTFESTDELMETWHRACDQARDVLGMVAS